MKKKKHMLYSWITEGYYYEIRGGKTHGRDKLYVRAGEGVVADCKSKGVNVIDNKKKKIQEGGGG